MNHTVKYHAKKGEDGSWIVEDIENFFDKFFWEEGTKVRKNCSIEVIFEEKGGAP